MREIVQGSEQSGIEDGLKKNGFWLKSPSSPEEFAHQELFNDEISVACSSHTMSSYHANKRVMYLNKQSELPSTNFI